MKNLSLILCLIFLITLCTQVVQAAEYQLDQPPGSNQINYSPFPRETVSVNPPPFNWVPPQRNLTYSLQISTERDFSEIVHHIKDIPVSTYALKQTLEPGSYYWRYGVQENKTVQWSHGRPFSVPESAQEFVMPKVDEVIDAIPDTRPRLFILNSELESYRKRAKSGDLKSARQLLLNSCERYIGATLVEEPPYVTGSGPERGKLYQKIFRETRPPMDAMERCALAYLLSGEVKYGNEAKRRILHFFNWNPEGSTAYQNNDEPAMWVMMRGTRAYDWTYDLFAPEEREKVEEVMRIRAQQFYDHLRNRRRFHTNPFESHAGRTLGFLGEAALSFAHQWPEAQQWLDYVMTLFWNVYPAWGKEDGGWHEGPSYWSYYMSFALHFVAPLREATGVDLMEKPFFQNTPYYKLYTNPPYAQISPFGDGEHSGPNRSMGQLMYHFSTLLDNPYFRWYADEKASGIDSSVLGIVLKDDSIKPKSPANLPRARYFPGVGLVSLHSDLGDAENDFHFLIHSDPYGAISHAHADQNAFTLDAYGEALAIASGYYPWYGSDHHRNWQWHSKSSNTITVDGGIGQKIRSADSKGEIVDFQSNEHIDYVKADASQAYPGTLERFIRHVVHIHPGLFVLYDEVNSKHEHHYEWWLHALSEMDDQPEQGRITISQGDARLRVQFIEPAEVNMTQMKGFPDPPEYGEPDQYHVTVTPKGKSKRERFLTVLVPYKHRQSVPAIKPGKVENGSAVRIETEEKSYLVKFLESDDNRVNCIVTSRLVNSEEETILFSTLPKTGINMR